MNTPDTAESDAGPRVITEARILYVSLDAESNAWGETVHVMPHGGSHE